MYKDKKTNIVFPIVIIFTIVLMVILVLWLDYKNDNKESNTNTDEPVITSESSEPQIENEDTSSSEFVVLHKDESKNIVKLGVKLQLLTLNIPDCPEEEGKDSLCYRHGVKAEAMLGFPEDQEIEKISFNSLDSLQTKKNITVRLVDADENIARFIVLKNKD